MKDYFKNDRWHPRGYTPTPMDIMRWEMLKALILNPLREMLGVPVRVTNGLRTVATFDRLVREGYHPSSKSDHFWGHEVWPTSTAAVDIMWDQKEASETYAGMVKWVANNRIDAISQVIHESQDGKNDWLHISLSREMVFGPFLATDIASMYPKPQALRGTNGKYSIVTGGGVKC